MYKKSKKLLAWSLVVCMILTQMLFTNAFAATRLEGTNRYATAAAIATAGGNTSDYAVLATGEGFADALAGAPLAAAYNAPILLTSSAALDSYAAQAIEDLGATTIFVVGGESAVSAAVVTALEEKGLTVERISGESRYATSVAIANKVAAKVGDVDSVVLANGLGYADALAVSSIAAAQGMPILLTAANAVSDDVKAFIGDKKVYVVGGVNAVNADVMAAFEGAERLSGADRYATNLAILKEFAADVDFSNVYVATAMGFADALAGSALAASNNGPIVLVGSSLASAMKAFLKANTTDDSEVTVFGGTNAVSASVAAAVEGAKPGVPAVLKVESVSAVNSITVAVKFNKDVDESTAEDVDAYVFNEVDGSDDLTVSEAELQDDDKTVYLTLDTTTPLVDDEVDYTVFVDTVEDTDGEEMDAYKEIVTLGDEVRPTVVSAKFADNDSYEIKFSEPVVEAVGSLEDDADVRNITAIEVVDEDEDEVEGIAVDFDEDDMDKVTLTGLSALDDEEDYTVRIFSEVADYSGNVITPNPYEKVFNVSEDDDDPEVKSISVLSNTAFKVVFNEAIDATVLFNVEISNTDITASADIEEVDDTNNKEFTVDFSAWVDAATVADETVKVNVNGFQDVSGNPDPASDSSYSKLLKFKDVSVELVSTVGKVKTLGGDKYAVFQFDEEIDAMNAAAVDFDRTDDNVVYSDTIAADKFFIADTPAAPAIEDDELAILVEGMDEGKYEITLDEGFVSSFGSDSEEADVTFTVTSSDSDVEVDEVETLPAADVSINGDGALEDDNNEIVVVFTDEVNSTAANVSNYTLDGVKVFEKAVFYASDDKDQIRLTLKEGAIRYNGDYVFEIKNVEDANGNELDDYKVTVQVTENAKPYITKATVTDVDTIEVTFKEVLKSAGATVDSDDFIVTVDGSEVDIQGCAFSVDTDKVIVITLDEAIDEEDAVVKVKTSADFDVEDLNGNTGKTNYEKTAVWDLD